jgi:hypothetical protein
MQVRFRCPACNSTHITDIPETTVHATCARTHKAVQLRLTPGGDVKSALVGQEEQDAGVEDE